MLCEICKTNKGRYSAVINGKYYKHICMLCKSAANKVSTGHADWSRGRDLEDHQADLMQPHNADGSVNADFCKLYPEQAKAVFTEEEIEKAMRK